MLDLKTEFRVVKGKPDLSVGQIVKVTEPDWWTAPSRDGEFEVTAVVPRELLGESYKTTVSGNDFLVQVTPELQPGHPHGPNVWYDISHFVPV